MSGLDLRLIRGVATITGTGRKRGWRSRFDQKDLVEASRRRITNADETGKSQLPGGMGRWPSGGQAPNETVQRRSFLGPAIAGGITATTAARRVDRVTHSKLDKAVIVHGRYHEIAYRRRSLVKVMRWWVSDGPLCWRASCAGTGSGSSRFPVDKTRNRRSLSQYAGGASRR